MVDGQNNNIFRAFSRDFLNCCWRNIRRPFYLPIEFSARIPVGTVPRFSCSFAKSRANQFFAVHFEDGQWQSVRVLRGKVAHPHHPRTHPEYQLVHRFSFSNFKAKISQLFGHVFFKLFLFAALSDHLELKEEKKFSIS